MQQLNKLVPDGAIITLTDCLGRPFIIETRNCKYASVCPSYNTSLTETVTVGIKGYPETEHEITKPVICTNGGGCGCSKWKRLTNRQIGGYDKPAEQVKAQSRNVSASVACTVESHTVDEVEQRLNRLKNLELGEL